MYIGVQVKCQLFNVHGSVNRKNIPIYIQQDATLHILVYLETALQASGGTITHHQEYTIISTASGICHTVTATCCYNRNVVDAVVCAPDDGLWYHPKHVEQFPDIIKCVKLHLVGYILEYQLFENFRQTFRKIYKYQISRKSVQWKPSCSMRTDRQTQADRHNEANSSFPKF